MEDVTFYGQFEFNGMTVVLGKENVSYFVWVEFPDKREKFLRCATYRVAVAYFKAFCGGYGS